MNIVKTFKRKTGSDFLQYASNKTTEVEVDGEIMTVIPCRLPFSNQGEVCESSDATHVFIKTQYDGVSMVKIGKL